MFLRSLKISTPNKIIRDINFHRGLNLIVDESEDQVTGNNVGKTTVLKLIDFCLGADDKIIFTDSENIKNEYKLVRDFLIDNEILITLILTDKILTNKSRNVIIECNFLSRNNTIRKINGTKILKRDFINELSKFIFPSYKIEKPTFRQIISHNIRYNNFSLENTLKTLNKYTTDVEYESLYLFLFGCKFDDGDLRQKNLSQIKIEQAYKSRLEKGNSRNTYETILNLTNKEIGKLEQEKSQLHINENLAKDLDKVNKIKAKINNLSTEISILSIRKDSILEAKEEFERHKSDIDLSLLSTIYKQAASFITNLQKRFEDLVEYHNQMVEQKIKFITQELPDLEKNIEIKKGELALLVRKEMDLDQKIFQSDTFEELESINIKINDLFKKKGEFETIISQIDEIDSIIHSLSEKLSISSENLFSEDFESNLKKQLEKFNILFSDISNYLYGEQYAISYDIIQNKDKHTIYKFHSLNTNMSSGKKQGEISCFDIAYTIFADQNNLPALHFLLNDKKELVHDNQLLKISEYVESNNIQFIASILRDKLPPELNKEENFVVKLSQQEKLFKIEQFNK